MNIDTVRFWNTGSSASLLSRRFDDEDEVLVFDTRFNETHLLDETGARIIELLDRYPGSAVDEILQRPLIGSLNHHQLQAYLKALTRTGLITAHS